MEPRPQVVSMCKALRPLLPSRAAAIPTPAAPPALSFATAVARYTRALAVLDSGTAETLLPVLLARDQVHVALSADRSALSDPDAIRNLAELDRRLKAEVPEAVFNKVYTTYRPTLAPTQERWWWHTDAQLLKRDEKWALLWRVGMLFLLALTSMLALDIFKRLLTGVPDTISSLVAIATLVLTSSALTSRGQAIGGWLLDWFQKPDIDRERNLRAQAGFLFALIIAGLVLGIWWWGLPRLAQYYHNLGTAIEKLDPAQADRTFQRAAALDPDIPYAYYQRGVHFDRVGLLPQAEEMYERALERDPDFLLPYNECGRVYILQGKSESAIGLLSVGLHKLEEQRKNGEVVDDWTRYVFYRNLGWAYYGTGQYTLARANLESAIKLEGADPDKISYPVHFLLAQTLEALGDQQAACLQWDLSRRYYNDDFLYGQGWVPLIRERYDQCTQETP